MRRPDVGAQRAPERADDAGRDGAMEAVRVADGDRQLADPERRRVAELSAGQVGRVDADHREVGLGIVARPDAAGSARPSDRVTLMRFAPWTTWLFVRT